MAFFGAFIILVIELVSGQNDVAPSPLPYKTPDVCSDVVGTIFQSGNLSCVSCVADYSEPSADGIL